MKQITISIPEPCHEGWDNMAPSEKGRFCGSCQKEVIDFTGMTDAELFAFFAQQRSGSVCGRTHVGQLDTPIAQPVVHKKKRFWYLQYAASLLLLLAKPGSGKAQVKQPITVAPQTKQTDILIGDTTIAAPPKPIRVTMGTVTPIQQTKTLKGTVVNEAGDPIAGASISIKNSKIGVEADADGHYQLRIKPKDIVLFSAIGYKTQKIVVNEKNLSITTVLKSSRSMLEGEVVIAGGISWCEEKDVAYNEPSYEALLQIKDKTSNAPLAAASLTVVENSRRTPEVFQTNNQGQYLLRKIKADETYTVIITAKDYPVKTITLNGHQLKKGNNTMTILLEKEPVVKTLDEVVIVSSNLGVKKVTGGPILVSQIKTQVEPSPIAMLPESILQGYVGGITVRPAVPPKQKVGFFKKIFSKPGANSKAGTTPLPVNTPALISIYPNPAKINGSIVVAFEKTPKGSYRLQLMDITGKRVQQAQISVPDGDFNFQWALESQVVAGSYVVTVTDAEGKMRLSSKIIITQ